jgi:hypothetical protein
MDDYLYLNNYLKYKNKYLNLKKQLGGDIELETNKNKLISHLNKLYLIYYNRLHGEIKEDPPYVIL